MLGSILGSVLGFIGAERANKSREDLSREQMAFQERMSSTAYSRAVGDMQQAGLNPMLAYSQGGASAPMGSMPQIENSVASAASGAQQALAMSQMVTQMEKTDAETAQIRSQTVGNDLVTARMVEEIQNLKATGRRTSEETMPNEELRDQLRTTTRATSAQAQKTSADARISNLTGMRDADTFEADVARRKAESKLTQMDLARGAADEKYNSDLGAMPKYLRLMLEVLRGTSSARGVR